MKILHITLKAFLLISVSMLCVTNLVAQVSYQYDNNGNRTAKVIVLNTLKNNDFAEMEADNDDSIVFDDKLGESSVKIYPNPTKGLLRVDIQNESEISGFIEIVNNVGKTICKTSDISLENQLDLSNQPNGVYVMRIVVNGKTSTWKIIKE
ncbi:MAG: T9SS type A sorting domain-containing protein [Bacteroidales bacterium]|nr:T9SS type A sorting domain-containing protein [Bacteroidales bacterium]